MDSQLISILIGFGFVVGMPLLEKLVEKIKKESRQLTQQVNTIAARQAQAMTPQRPDRQRPRIKQKQTHPIPPKEPETFVEGERATKDTPPMSPIGTGNRPKISAQELRKAVIWSEILANPKFKQL